MKVPLTINEVLMVRIDRLDEETKQLIKTASVIGRYFFHKIIAQVAQNISDIDSRLSHLEDIQLIRERKRMDELEYLFKHALAQEAAYESLLIQRRKELHLHVAQSIESVFCDRMREFYGMLAYHYSMGENSTKAEEYMHKAGEEAKKTSASTEMIYYYMNVMNLFLRTHGDQADQTRLADYEENIGTAFFIKGRFGESCEHLEKALSRLGCVVNPGVINVASSLVTLMRLLLRVYLSINPKKLPGEKDIRIIKLGYFAAQAFTVNDFVKSMLAGIISLKLTLRFDITKSQECFDMISASSLIFSYGGLSLKISRRILYYALETLRENTQSFSLNNFTYCMIMHKVCAGEWEDGYDASQIQSMIKSGLLFPAAASTIWTGNKFLEKGDFNVTEKIIEDCRSFGENYNYDHALIDYYRLKIKYFIKKHLPGDAAQLMDLAMRHVERTGQTLRAVEFLGLQLLIAMLNDDIVAAGRIIEDVSRHIGKIGRRFITQFFYADYGIGLCQQRLSLLERSLEGNASGTHNEIKRGALTAVKDAVRANKASALDRTESIRLTGIYYWLVGKEIKALRWWKKSIDIGERLGAKLELSRTYFEVGKRVYLVEGSNLNRQLRNRVNTIIGLTPEECLAKAEALFREMDLQWDLEQVEKVKAAYK